VCDKAEGKASMLDGWWCDSQCRETFVWVGLVNTIMHIATG
jgi:hypothetical protein